MSHVMIDLETLGTDADAVIASIGAVVFTSSEVGTETSGGVFFRRVTIKEQPGRRLDPDTVLWWLHQSREAIETSFGSGKIELPVALRDLHDWARSVGATDFWGWPAAFDLSILDHAYRAAGIGRPWSRRNLHCARTLCRFANVERPANPAKHHPVEDARCQAIATGRALWVVDRRIEALERRTL